ncbi:MAG: hypothetical protein ACK504_05240 [Bacteroidota bacterium]
MRTIKNIISFISFSIIILSCNDQVEELKEGQEKINDSIAAKGTDDGSLNDEQTSYNLPSALQIAYVSKKTDPFFNERFLNNIKNVNRYNTSNYKRAVNFGIYSFDLANCLFNKNYQKSEEYLKALKEQGGYLGLNSAFENDKLSERFDNNLRNEDTLIKIVSEVQLLTNLLFEQKKQKHIIVIAFAGALVESINISSQVQEQKKNKKILANICEQLLLTKTLLKALEVFKHKEPEISELLNAITAINDSFRNIPTIKIALEKEEEIDFNTLNYTESEIKSVTDLVKDLRNKMVN